MKLLIKLAFWVVVLTAAPSLIIAAERHESERQEALMLWEQLIAAKGGRESLYRIDSLAMSYEETVRNFLGLVVHRGPVERLYAFPYKSWEWDDGLPPPFRRTVRLLNIEKNLRCFLYSGVPGPKCGPVAQSISPADEGISQVQYLYLMETKWVKPIPIKITKDRIGLKGVDVLHTRFQNKRIDYFLDRKTHLPIRIAVFYGRDDRATLSVDISDYVNVSGIKMPTKQKKGTIQFQINPEFDNEIFNVPPTLEKGPYGWRPLRRSSQ